MTECKACKTEIAEEYNYCQWCGITQKWDRVTKAHVSFGDKE